MLIETFSPPSSLPLLLWNKSAVCEAVPNVSLTTSMLKVLECVLALARNILNIPGDNEDVFELESVGLHATRLPAERLSFSYDNLNVHMYSSGKHYSELFGFSDNLENVVVTINGTFFKFLNSQVVVDRFVRKDLSFAAYKSKPFDPGGSYRMVTVPVLNRFYRRRVTQPMKFVEGTSCKFQPFG